MVFYHLSCRPHTFGAVEERKTKFVRMFGARKACYKCGNGVSEPFYTIRVWADTV